MDEFVIFNSVVLAAVAVNLFHWTFRGRHQLFFWPMGWLGWAVNGALIVITIVAPLILLHIVRGNFFTVLLDTCLLIRCIDSIWHRGGIWRTRRVTVVA